jgi:hypothetical protein
MRVRHKSRDSIPCHGETHQQQVDEEMGLVKKITRSWVLLQQLAARQSSFAFNSAIGGTLCALSDAVAQNLERRYNVLGQNDDINIAMKGTLTEENESGVNHALHERIVDESSNEKCSKVLATSDVVVDTPHQLDYRRFVVAAGVGAFLGGTVYPYAYAQLDRYFKGTSLLTVLQKSIFEICSVGIFVNTLSMTTRGLLQNGDHSSFSFVCKHVMRELPVVTRTDFSVWLPYNILAFSCIPISIRPATTSFMEAAWQTYISYKSHNYNIEKTLH